MLQREKSMKLSCLPVSFYREIMDGEISIVDWGRIALDAGLDAIELSIILIAAISPSSVTLSLSASTANR
jgi:hypothetical protein